MSTEKEKIDKVQKAECKSGSMLILCQYSMQRYSSDIGKIDKVQKAEWKSGSMLIICMLVFFLYIDTAAIQARQMKYRKQSGRVGVC